jgi:DNA-binding protein HU-beta
MNKADVIYNVSTKSGINKQDTTTIVEGFLTEVTEQLANGEKVSLIGFGNFEVRERSARKGRNPQTGQEIDIASSKNPAWKPSKKLKEIINQ